MKIGICAFPLSRGKETGRGLERVMEEFCQYLDLHNIEYEVYEKGIIRNELFAAIKSIFFYFYLKKKTSDCYFSAYAVSSIFPIMTKKTPVVTLITDLIPLEVFGYDNYIKYSIKRFCIKIAVLKSTTIIVGSNSIKIGLIKSFKIDPKKIKVVPWGVNLTAYFPNKNVKKNRHNISFIGEIKLAKGIDSLIQSFKLVLREIPDATLTIGGTGRDLNAMKKLAKATLPDSTYTFQGIIAEKNMNAFYNASSLFVFPSRYGFGLSALEAMACKIPAIVGNTLDSKDFFSDNMMLVDPNNPIELAKKIVYLFKNESIYFDKAEKALKLAKKFSWENTFNQYIKIIKSTSKVD
jgi:glycosyltransferase involved in cell wall biosynthesis